MPDEASRQKIHEKESSDFIERYRDYIDLGYIEWEQQYEALKNHKTPILFIMTMNTKEADHAVEFLQTINTAQNNYLYTPVYVKQEKWEEIKKDLKTFKDFCKLFKINE